VNPPSQRPTGRPARHRAGSCGCCRSPGPSPPAWRRSSWGWPSGWRPGLRAGGCGFLYGLLAFHLQRVDPDDSHLQAGLVGAVCGIHSLALPAASAWPAELSLPAGLLAVAPAVMMELIRAWVPLVGAALLLHLLLHLTLHLLPHGSPLVAHRVPSARRP
jgi:hypothetical protein